MDDRLSAPPVIYKSLGRISQVIWSAYLLYSFFKIFSKNFLSIYKVNKNGTFFIKYANDIGKDINSLNFIYNNIIQNNRNKIFIIVSKKK